ncbi:DUF6325 family protein [Jiangella asiatica]|uniref:DUF1269 domain-containing protein n=1 Tax=Jiangella asiatica TaxID=2530372 RepID=A0A4R5CWI1_9ACTN|nr:DUF6325 family protein [Jiangella asiatica]TDE03391.1 DUF1269 domain-containing protein [Jiangella asiatica]
MRFRSVEVLILTFPGERVEPLAVEALRGVVEMGDVTLLDVVFVSRDPHGDLRVLEFADGGELFGFSDVEVAGRDLLNDEDIAIVAETLEAGSSAVVIAYENTWVRRVSEAIGEAGGQVALNVLIPSETADDALRAVEEADRTRGNR